MKLYSLLFICFGYFTASEHTVNNESCPPILFKTAPGYKLYYKFDSTFNSPEIIFMQEHFKNNEKCAEEWIRPKLSTIHDLETKSISYKMGAQASTRYAQMMSEYNSFQQNQFPSQKSKKRRCN